MICPAYGTLMYRKCTAYGTLKVIDSLGLYRWNAYPIYFLYFMGLTAIRPFRNSKKYKNIENRSLSGTRYSGTDKKIDPSTAATVKGSWG